MAHGRVVKGVSFVGLRDVGDPVELATHYSDGGADELVLLDIAATPDDSSTMLEVVAMVADAITIPFTVGGGVRSVRDAAHYRGRSRPSELELGRSGNAISHH